jgi:hypothetical protein
MTKADVLLGPFYWLSLNLFDKVLGFFEAYSRCSAVVFDRLNLIAALKRLNPVLWQTSTQVKLDPRMLEQGVQLPV